MRLNINPNRTRRSCGVSVSIQPPALLSILKVKTIAIVPPTDLRSHGALYSPISRMAQAPKYSCGFPCFARLIRGWHNSYQQVQSLIFGGIQRGELSKSAMNLQAEVTSGFLEQLEN